MNLYTLHPIKQGHFMAHHPGNKKPAPNFSEAGLPFSPLKTDGRI
jgi:hypothetical protein